MSTKIISIMSRLRARAARRGVAMVEGAVVFPVMAGFLILFEISHHSYDLKVTTIHRARENAWSFALEGCKKGRDDDSYKKPYFTIDQIETGEGGGSVPHVGLPLVSIPLPDVDAANATVSGNATAHRGGRTFEKRAGSMTTLVCNPTLGPRLKLQTLIDNFLN